MANLFQQIAIPVQNPVVFGQVKSAIEAAFVPAAVQGFLKNVNRSRLRVREFERVLGQGLLGDAAKTGYAQLGDSDRGQVRELYLRSVEQVALDTRKKFLKIYAYY